jgi:quinol monooxygenase YgiN
MSPRRAARLLAVAALAASALLAGRTAAQEKAQSLPDQIKAAVKGQDKPFTLAIHLKIKEDARDKLEAAFARASKETHKEKGCLAYDLNRSAKEPTHYLLYERWASPSAWERHVKTDYTRALLKEFAGLVAGPPEVHVLVPAGD